MPRTSDFCDAAIEILERSYADGSLSGRQNCPKRQECLNLILAIPQGDYATRTDLDKKIINWFYNRKAASRTNSATQQPLPTAQAPETTERVARYTFTEARGRKAYPELFAQTLASDICRSLDIANTVENRAYLLPEAIRRIKEDPDVRQMAIDWAASRNKSVPISRRKAQRRACDGLDRALQAFEAAGGTALVICSIGNVDRVKAVGSTAVGAHRLMQKMGFSLRDLFSVVSKLKIFELAEAESSQ